MLFSPFRLGRCLKLAASAYLGRAGTIFVPFQLIYLALLPRVADSARTGPMLLLIGGVVVFTAIFAVIFYLSSRMQFAVFGLILERSDRVAPAWRRYGWQSRSWTTFKIALGSALTLAMAVPLVGYGRRVVALMTTIKPGEPPPPAFMLALFGGYALLLLVFGSFFFLSAVVNDLVLPPLALDGATLRQALGAARNLVRREPGEIALFAILKIGLMIVGTLGVVVAVELAALVVFAVIGGIAALIGYLLHTAGVPLPLLIALGVALAVVLYFACLLLPLLLAAGAVSFFVDAHAAYFLGGRFPSVGEVLERTEPTANARLPFSPPPPPLPAV